MSYALGQVVPLTITVRDAAGVPADGGTVTLSVTRPAGTTDTYTGGQLTHTIGTGIYQLDYVAVAAGLYAVRWVVTGANASAPKVDSFYVERSDLPPIVSLAEARQHLGFPAAKTADDDQLADFLQTACQVCEDYTGMAWRRQSLTATFDGGQRTLQLRVPVLSVTSVTENGTTLAGTAYVLDASQGWLHRAPGGARWSSTAPQNIVVAYVAGPVDGIVPATIRQGSLEMVRHLWESQRGRAVPAGRGPDSEFPTGTSYSIPNRVRELWEAAMLPGFA